MTETLAGISFAARVSGVVIAFGYLLGLVPGPLVAVIGALALISFGRGLAQPRGSEAVAGAGLAVIAGALGVAALRWGTLDLGSLRGAQAVLGPTVLVGPGAAAGAAWIAAIAAVAGLGVSLDERRSPGRLSLVWWAVEAIVGALAIVTAFWGAAVGETAEAGAFATGIASWVGAVTVVTVLALAISTVRSRAGARLTWALLATAAVVVLLSAGLVRTALG